MGVARTEPRTLAIGLDASAPSMAQSVRRARRAGVRNALFVVASVEMLPGQLRGIADAITVHFPWGSLLRGVLAQDDAALSGLAGACRPGSGLTALVSLTERERALGLRVPPAGELAAGYARHGLTLSGLREANPHDVSASGSSWAKRLQVGSARPAWFLAARRA